MGDKVTDFRADIIVKNISDEKETFSIYNSAIIIGSSQYDVISYRSELDGSDMRPGIEREGYLLFEIPGKLDGLEELILGGYYSYPNNVEYTVPFNFNTLISPTPLLTLKTDKTSYTLGESIVVSGKVEQVSSTPISVTVFNDEGLVYNNFALYPESDGTYVGEFELKMNRFAVGGSWKLKAAYLSESAETNIMVEVPLEEKPSQPKNERSSPELSTQESMGADISVAMKHKKKITLLAVKNNDEFPIYMLELKAMDDKIRFVKAKDWERSKLDASTVMIQTEDRPITKGGNMIVLLILDDKNSWLECKAFDEEHNLLLSDLLISK